jgi:uncharacterized protein (DUF1786 family)
MNILCLDIGSGTQDVLLYMEGRELENCPKFVIPSPAALRSQEIGRLTELGKPIYLFGQNMGGGFGQALSGHLERGLKAAAHPRAALAISDNPDKVRAMGVALSEECPPGFTPVCLSDFEPAFWRSFLAQLSLDMPDMVAAAAQDHGYHPDSSNRLGRFNIWRSFLEQQQGRAEALLFDRPPETFTRLAAIQEAAGGGVVADTGAAAVLGAMFDPRVEAEARQGGVCVVNVGNSHCLVFLICQERIVGILEHHTGLLTPEKLWEQIETFRAGRLSNQEVFDDWGHGCHLLDTAVSSGPFDPVYVIGPRRQLLDGYPVRFLCPGGDVMLAGCFGLLKGLEMQGRIGPVPRGAVAAE